MKVSALLAQLIALVPSSALRRFGYRIFLGYDIAKGARIGFGTFIAVEGATIGKCNISKFNRFVGPMQLHIGDGAQIGARNRFDCGHWAKTVEAVGTPYARSLHIGNRVVITGQHHFDIVGDLHIGDRTWVAGVGSQFWTHGAGVEHRDVFIGADCYIGSAVRFTPGSSVAEGSIIGVGSVVTKAFTEKNAFLAGVPAQWVKQADAWQSQRSAQVAPG